MHAIAIRVVGLFSAKMGEAHLLARSYLAATRALKDALALSRAGEERARIWELMSRVASAQGHSREAAEYADAADRETAASSARRAATEPPPAVGEGSSRRRN